MKTAPRIMWGPFTYWPGCRQVYMYRLSISIHQWIDRRVPLGYFFGWHLGCHGVV